MKLRTGRILKRLAGKERSLHHWAQALSISATLSWMAVTLYFLGSSDPPSPEAPPWWFPGLGHLYLFAVLGFLTMLTLSTLERSSGWISSLAMVVVFGFLWGSTTELYQGTIPSRNASWEDLLLDAAGAFLGGAGSKVTGLWAYRYLGWHRL
jgi:VanZ family protein